MKGKSKAKSKHLFELENLFDINQGNEIIHQIGKDEEEYEQAVKEKVILDDQNQLRQLNAKKVNHKANSIKDE